MINKTKTLFFFLLKIIIKYITKNNNSLKILPIDYLSKAGIVTFEE